MRGRKDRNLMVYKTWRSEVFARDYYACQLCGARSGLGKSISLNAHHLLSWTKFPDKRYDVENGMTLCEDCHDEFRKIDLSELAKIREAERYCDAIL